MSSLRAFLLLSLFHLVFSGVGLAQQKSPFDPPVEIDLTKFRVEQASAPGGGKPWIRLLCDFTVQPAWADGIVFYYDVLVRRGDESRVLSGSARYTNVKRGNHTAVLYMSPSAVERFGTPVAAMVRSSYKDDSSGSIEWSSAEAGRPPENWVTQFQRYSSQLLPIIATPFVATEYGKYPDILVVQ